MKITSHRALKQELERADLLLKIATGQPVPPREKTPPSPSLLERLSPADLLSKMIRHVCSFTKGLVDLLDWH
jgi:hypothetical protein